MQKKNIKKTIRDLAVRRFTVAFGTILTGEVTGIELAVHTGLGCPPLLTGLPGILRVFAIALVGAGLYTTYKTIIDLFEVVDHCLSHKKAAHPPTTLD